MDGTETKYAREVSAPKKQVSRNARTGSPDSEARRKLERHSEFEVSSSALGAIPGTMDPKLFKRIFGSSAMQQARLRKRTRR